MKRSLRAGRLRRSRYHDDINPMDGLANLADVMLVLACGLMLSLIVAWNVDIGRSEKLVGVDQGSALTEFNTQQSENANSTADQKSYEEYGVVYRDPVTGKLFMAVDTGK
jgi:hypothetical protein